MEIEEIIQKFLTNPIYITNGAGFLAKRWNTTIEKIKIAKNKTRLINLENEFKKGENKKFKRMFFDIETSYNVIADFSCGYEKTIGPHQILKERAIICICWKWENEDKVNHLKWDNNQCDKKMLTTFVKEMEKADEVIGHNGDKFDLRWLRGRAIIHQLNFPTYVKSLDTLKKVRQAAYFNSNKLDYLAKLFLGYGKVDTGGFQLWVDICENNDKSAMNKMVEYCKNDVVILEEVYHRINPYITHNTHVGVNKGNSKASCKSCGSEDIKLKRNVFTSAGTIQKHIECNKCGLDYKISNTAWKSFLKLKNNG